jgi:serine/threonine-protein kinase
VKSDNWERLERVFFAALELAPTDRRTYLDQVCGGDVVFRDEVEAVLAAHAQEEVDELRRSGSQPVVPATPSLIGTRVGAYQLEALVGRGGMGEVYRARRVDDQYHQEVAVKLIRGGVAGRALAERFRLERQVLARLQHPNIATLLDGGITADSRNYLVMQYVDGVPLTEYADANRLSVRDRIQLVRTVCDTVQFAHANLVVHRDLKPTNILVTKDGQVKLLDFGIAKLLDPERLGVTAPSTEEILLLTPEHAAPEQIRGEQITTATDVYALGVLLYELLTGSRPFYGKSRDELHRAVLDLEPQRPSALAVAHRSPRDERVPPDPAVIAELRATRPESLTRQLRGDLDHIVLMALRKEPARRYASAGQLGEDLGRFLGGRPVMAQRDTFRYRAAKFLRRNRAAALLAALALTSLVGGLFGTTWQARRARIEAAQSAADRDRAERVSALLVDMFELSDPGTVRGQSITAREVLDRGVAGIERDFADQPQLQADLLTDVGRIYENLGLFDEASGFLERAVALQLTLHGEGHPRTAESLTALAHVRTEQASPDEAVAYAERAVVALRSGRDDGRAEALGRALVHLGEALRMRGDHEAAGEAYQNALVVFAETAPSNEVRRVEALYGLANSAHDLGQFERADSLLQETVRQYAGLREGPYPEHAVSLNNLAMIRMFRRRADEADSLLREALAIRREIYGASHPAVAETLTGLMQALSLQGRYREGMEVGLEAVAASDSALGPHHLNRAEVRQGLAFIFLQLNMGERAIEVLEQAARIYSTQLEEGDSRLVGNGIITGQAYASMGQWDRARERYAQTLAYSDSVLGPDHAYHAHILLEISRIDQDAGRLELAETEARESLGLTQRTLRADHRFALWATVVLARIRTESGRLSAADSLLTGVLQVQQQTIGDGHPETVLTLIALADVKIRLERHGEAETHARAAIGVLGDREPWSSGRAEAASILGAALAAQGRLEEARPLLERAVRDLSARRGVRRYQLNDAQARLRRFAG